MPNVSAGVPPLGKKQANLLTAVLRGVPVLGPGKETRPLTDSDIHRLLDALPPCADAQETGEVNRLRPRLLNALVGPEARRSGYVQGLPRHGVAPLLRAAGRGRQGPAGAADRLRRQHPRSRCGRSVTCCPPSAWPPG